LKYVPVVRKNPTKAGHQPLGCLAETVSIVSKDVVASKLNGLENDL
jgi:hypothetical protein